MGEGAACSRYADGEKKGLPEVRVSRRGIVNDRKLRENSWLWLRKSMSCLWNALVSLPTYNRNAKGGRYATHPDTALRGRQAK
jgi:hypothetical protein